MYAIEDKRTIILNDVENGSSAICWSPFTVTTVIVTNELNDSDKVVNVKRIGEIVEGYSDNVTDISLERIVHDIFLKVDEAVIKDNSDAFVLLVELKDHTTGSTISKHI